MSHALLFALIFFAVGTPAMIFGGYLLAVKQRRDLVFNWDETQVTDPETAARIIGNSAISSGILLPFPSILLHFDVLSLVFCALLTVFVSFIPVLGMFYANVKYAKRR